VIVVCASDFPDGGRGIDVFQHVRAKHPEARVVLMTTSERDAFVTALSTQIDGFVTKDDPLTPLRSILRYLGRGGGLNELRRGELAGPRAQRDEFQLAVVAMSSALEAVERAHDALANADDQHSRAARESLREAETLAVVAHRRMLDAERKLRAQQA
jgi:DNA-binding NarL/FixJ family response regulator